jgi:NADH dehydrogenase (ubiquinone) 1 beta subcomplex subunit 7
MGETEHHSEAVMPRAKQDLQALRDHGVPPAYRDNCAHLLIPLNQCRLENFHLPFRCVDERHGYEECEYIAWKSRRDENYKRLNEKKRREAEEQAALAA